MSVPKSNVLKCNGGFLAQADVPVNSPHQEQTTNVNVLVNPYKSENTEINKENEHLSTTEYYPQINFPTKSDFNVNDIKERDINTANIQLEELQKLTSDQKNLIDALNIMLDAYENNPLIINKYVICNYSSLKKLIKLLTSSDKVEINVLDAEINCGCKPKYFIINKIIITKNNETFNLKYNFPDVIQFLDKHKISYKLYC